MADLLIDLAPLILLAGLVGGAGALLVIWRRRSPSAILGRCPAIDGRGQRCVRSAFHTDEHSTSRFLQGWLQPITPPAHPAEGDTFLAVFTAPNRDWAAKLAERHAASIAELGWRRRSEWFTEGFEASGLVLHAARSVDLVVTYEYRPRGS